MIKKLIILAILGGLGYVGYLVWTQHLSDSDKATIKQKLSDTGKSLKKGASKLAKGTADVVKDGLNTDDKKDTGKEEPKKDSEPVDEKDPAPTD